MQLIIAGVNLPLLHKLETKFGQPIIIVKKIYLQNNEFSFQFSQPLADDNIKLIFNLQDGNEYEQLFFLYELVNYLVKNGTRNLQIYIPFIEMIRKAQQEKNYLFSRLLEYITKDINCKIYALDTYTELPNQYCHIHNYSLIDFWTKIYHQYFKRDFVIVAPDYGARAKAKNLASNLNLEFLFIHKNNLPNNMPYQANYLIYDDIIDSGNSLNIVARFLKENGATSVQVFVSHALLSYETYRKNITYIDKIFTTNTITHNEHLDKKIEVLDIYQYILAKI